MASPSGPRGQPRPRVQQHGHGTVIICPPELPLLASWSPAPGLTGGGGVWRDRGRGRRGGDGPPSGAGRQQGPGGWASPHAFHLLSPLTTTNVLIPTYKGEHCAPQRPRPGQVQARLQAQLREAKPAPTSPRGPHGSSFHVLSKLLPPRPPPTTLHVNGENHEASPPTPGALRGAGRSATPTR